MKCALVTLYARPASLFLVLSRSRAHALIPAVVHTHRYLHIFEMYTNQTFPLIICSEKGKGKSVRAMRMGHILPPGWVTFNSANTERSGMNGTLASQAEALHSHPCPTLVLTLDLPHTQATMRRPMAQPSFATR